MTYKNKVVIVLDHFDAFFHRPFRYVLVALFAIVAVWTFDMINVKSAKCVRVDQLEHGPLPIRAAHFGQLAVENFVTLIDNKPHVWIRAVFPLLG